MRVRTLAESGDKRAAMVAAVIEDPPRCLSTILIGNNICESVSLFPDDNPDPARVWQCGGWRSHRRLTLLIPVFGEITPKDYVHAVCGENLFCLMQVPSMLMVVLTPVIFIVIKLSMGVPFLLRADPNKSRIP